MANKFILGGPGENQPDHITLYIQFTRTTIYYLLELSKYQKEKKEKKHRG